MSAVWITVAEAAKLAGRSPGTVYEWIRSGKLRSRLNARGAVEVFGSQVVDVESATRRGRPRRPAPIETKRSGEELLLDAILRPTPRPPGVVYYVRWADRIKIGTSTNLQHRLRSIPYDRVLAIEPGGHELERERHRQFRHLLVDGQTEWFHDAPELQVHIDAIVGAHGEPNVRRANSMEEGREPA